MSSNGHTPAIKSEQLKVCNGSISLIAPTPLLGRSSNAIHQNFDEPYRHRNLRGAWQSERRRDGPGDTLSCRDGRLPAGLAGFARSFAVRANRSCPGSLITRRVAIATSTIRCGRGSMLDKHPLSSVEHRATPDRQASF